MRAILAARFPDHAIIGEEAGEDRAGARWRWVLDPIDGTRAFITGRPIFGTLIALLDGETPVLGLIDQPITSERWLGVTGRPHPIPRQLRPRRRQAMPQPGRSRAELHLARHLPARRDPPLPAPGRPGAPRHLGWRLLRLRPAGARPDRHRGRSDAETLGLGPALVPVIQGAGGSITDWAGRALHSGSDGTVLALGDPALLHAAVKALES